MKTRALSILAALAFTLVLPSFAAAEDLVDNPAYKYWAAYKPGTFVTHSQAITIDMGKENPDAPAMPKMESRMTRKLTELTPEQAVIEVTTVASVMGKEHTMTNKQVIPAKVTKEKADGPMVENADAKITDFKTGKDTIEVDGKKLDCTTQEFTLTSDKQSGHNKMWLNAAIPGGLVKMQMDMATPMKASVNMVLVEYKAPK